MKKPTPGKFTRREEGECHPHSFPAHTTTTNYESRQRAYDQKVTADHYRWARGKRRRLMRKATRRAQRVAAGFSGIEVLVVMAIVAILLAIVIPTYMGATNHATGKNTGNDIKMPQSQYTDYLINEGGSNQWRFTIYRNIMINGEYCSVIKTEEGVSTVCPTTPR